MTPLFFRRTTASLLCIAALCAPASAVHAQAGAVEQEALELYVGDIFEILPVHAMGDATYTWILTQDRNFIEAGRAQTFRKRLITPGRYSLYAEITSADQARHISRTFVLDYMPRTPGQPMLPATATGASNTSLVRTVPAQDGNARVIVPTQSQLVKLEPINPDVRPLVADLDVNTDTDGDGNPANDIDTDLTFFQTDATPLYVWLAEPLSVRTLSITAAMPDGAMVQRIEVAGESYARAQGLIQHTVGMDIQPMGGRRFNFKATFDVPAAPNAPLLYHWEFGDGQQSLLANPSHEYAADGFYEVKLRIRNLADGKEVASFSREVEAADTSAVPEDPVTPTPGETPAEGGLSFRSILLMIGIFVGSILLGLLVIYLFSKLRRKGTSISDTLEAMEQSIVKKEDATKTPTLSIAPAPTATKPTTPPPSIAKREEERPVQNAAPTAETANAPAWLKGGLSVPNAPATPAPRPQQAPPVTPKPQPTPAPTPPAAQKPASVPPWLQTPATPPVKPQPTPAAQPQSQQKPPVPAPVKPVPTPATPAAPRIPTPVQPPKPPVAPPATPAPVSAPLPSNPVVPPAPAPLDQSNDQEVAIIRAESLETPPQNQPQPPAETPPAGA